MKASLLTVGSEILDGRIINTNAKYLAESLEPLGISIHSVLSCDDVESDIVSSLQFLLGSVDVVIITGGLGPTSDDLTREAVAKYFNVALIQNEEALVTLEALYKKRNRVMDPSNSKQALFPKTATVIQNPVGTAAGFLIESSQKKVFSFPGVPKELYAMCEETLLPFLKKSYSGLTPQNKFSFKVFGLAESVIGSRINALTLADTTTVSYRAAFPEVHVVLKSIYALDAEGASCIEAVGGDFVFTTQLHRSLASVVVDLLREQQKTIAVAEEITGGIVSRLLTEEIESIETFKGATVFPEVSIVSKTTRDLAAEVRYRYHSSIGLSISTPLISGSATSGSDGDIPANPEGTFFLGLSTRKESKSYKFFFSSGRAFTKKFAAYKALDLVRRILLELPLPADLIVSEE